MFSVIVTFIGEARLPTYQKKLFLGNTIFYPIKLHVHGFWFFWRMDEFTMPADVELSVLMGVLGWVYPISYKHVRMGLATCPL